MTGDENTQETEATLSRKFTQTPSNTNIVDGTAYPILAARLPMRNPSEVNVDLITPFNPVSGSYQMPVVIQDTTTPAQQASVSPGYDGGMGVNNNNLWINSFQQVTTAGQGTTNQVVRTPTKYKWAACTTTAATDLWTPAGGKKFRVMGGTINCAGGLLAAGLETVDLQEETLGTFGLKFGTWVPIAASAAATPQIYFDLRPNGYLATTADKKLQVVLGAAMTAGAVEVTVWGTEE